VSDRVARLKLKAGVVAERRGDRLVVQELAHVPDPLDRVKHLLKRHPALYRFAKYVLSPVYFDSAEADFIRAHVEGREGCFINLGSGNFRLHERIANVDIFAYDEVDLVCDITRLPLEDASVDVVMDLSLLEHVPDPAAIVDEIYRVLKPGGVVYTDAPFVVGFHASPHDYTRWTEKGLARLFRKFEVQRLEIAGGPTSAFLWIGQEWLAMVLSLGSTALYRLLHVALMVATFPLKYLDAVLRRHPMAGTIALSFALIARKPLADK